MPVTLLVGCHRQVDNGNFLNRTLPHATTQRWVDSEHDLTLLLDGAHEVVGADADYEHFTSPDLRKEMPCAMPDGSTKLGVRR